MSNNRSRLRDHASKLHREVRRLRIKTLRAPGQRYRAIEAAIAETAGDSGTQSNVWRIKRPDGRIENWVRDLSCRLIAVRHLPASQTPGAISDIIQAIKAHTGDHDGANNHHPDPHANPSSKETFSDRSARRFPLEGHAMGKIRAAQDFKAAPG